MILALYPPYLNEPQLYMDDNEVSVKKCFVYSDNGYENIEPGKVIKNWAYKGCVKCSDSLLENLKAVLIFDIEIEYLL